jgi:hypothetical protein
MSLTITDTAYSGTFASYFWLPATFSMDTVSKGAVYVKDGIKKQHTIGRVDFSQPLQPRQATPVSAGTYTIDGRLLKPEDVMLYTEFNPRDFEDHWLAEELSPTLLARELPVTAENYMLQIALNRAMQQIELGVWMGSMAYAGAVPATDARYQLQFFNGFMQKFVNDASIFTVPTPVAITTSNVNTIMDSLLSLVAANKKALLSRPTRYERMKFFVSINTEQIYDTFLTTSLTFKGVNTTEKGINKYKGYEIVPLAGFPDDTILFCEGLPDATSNLYVGMNSTEDNNLELMRLQNNSELFFLKGLMKYDTQYGWSNEIFLYTTLTPSSFEP